MPFFDEIPPRLRTIAGAMSGTSADGVDIALVQIRGQGLSLQAKLLRHTHYAYSQSLRERIISIRRSGMCALSEMARVTEAISHAYAEAVAKTRENEPIDAIAAHGQTVYHDPPRTMQWLDPSLLAAKTGCPVISDFRRADCAAGGQGAPLVPLADYLLFRHATRSRVLLNIGGIANLTFIPAGASIEALLAFDTGPGNCISDFLAPPLDPAGRQAASGKVIEPILKRALASDYFHRPPPKSTDGPAMIALFENDLQMPLNDRLRTACQFTATTIADAIRQHCAGTEELIISGGGTENKTLMNLLRESLSGISILTTEDLGVPSQAKEAIAFALLGAATLDGLPGNVPSCTGAARSVVLGSITPKP